MTMTAERPVNEQRLTLPFSATVARRDLANAIRLPVKVASGRTTWELLNCLRLEVREGSLLAHASNLEVEASATCPAEGSGITCTDAARFSQAVGSLPEGEVRLQVVEDQLEMVCGKTRLQLPCLPADEFPPMTTANAEKWEVPGKDLAQVFKVVAPAASTDGTRVLLTGVSLSNGEMGLRAIATDTHILHIANILNADAPQGASIIPARAVALLLDGLDEDCCWEVQIGAHQVEVADGVTRIVSRLIDGQFPKVDRVVPGACGTSWTVGLDDLILALKRLRTVSDGGETLNTAAFEIDDAGDLLLTARTGRGTAEDRLSVEVDGAPIRIAFTIEILTRCLAALKQTGADRLKISLNDPVSAALLEPVDGGGVRAVVMPVQP